MSVNQCKVQFNPDNVEITVDQGANLLAAAMSAGVHVTASCGGMGVCGTCKVKIESGNVESPRTEKLSEEEFKQGIRQACQSKVLTDLVVTIPVRSRLDHAIQAIENKKSSGVSAMGWKYNPLVKKYYIELDPATIDDNISDISRIRRGLKQQYHLEAIEIDFEVLKKAPLVLRETGFKLTVTVLTELTAETFTRRITNIEPGDTREHLYALAVDIGTTTVCSQLLDLNRGKILLNNIVFNKQISYGSDVITRIAYSQKPGGLTKLQKSVVDSINETIDNFKKSLSFNEEDICYVCIAGNTTMQQLLTGLDPKYIRLSPYVPVTNFIPLIKASELGLHVGDQVYLYTFPSVSSYIGGDIVSGAVASGMYQRKILTLYMDLGTNGEIVIGNDEWMVTASCSAGPAFEGGGIKFGMVAMSGAIQDFSIDPNTLEPTIRTIGDVKPKGICGSGLINTIAALLEVGIIGQDGKYNTNLNIPRIRKGTDNYEYVLAWANETQIGQDISLTEVDIDNLIRAKAAMYAGCHTLTRSVNIDCADIEQVILAGNFGSSLDVEKAIAIGLLPDIPRERFTFVGNGSLSGARLVTFSTDLLSDARKVGHMMTNIELSENTDFTDSYIAALFLPHTDEKAFPNITQKLIHNK